MTSSPQNNNVTWQCKTFNQLSNNELYDILKLRINVFVVEQTCYYPDLDDHDRNKHSQHLFCYYQNKLAAYLRILPKGLTYDEHASIGRVVVAEHARGLGLGHELIQQGLHFCQHYFPEDTIKISAQEHLEQYYQQHGFVRVSDMYLEDNIPHIAMRFIAN